MKVFEQPVAKVVSTKGLKGVLKSTVIVNDLPDLSVCYIESFPLLTINILDSKKNFIWIKVQTIDSIDDAKQIVGKNIFLREAEPITDQNTFYSYDLIGMEVFSMEKKYGIITKIENYGAGDIMTIKNLFDQEESFSFSQDIFPKVDIKNRYIEIRIPKKIDDS